MTFHVSEKNITAKYPKLFLVATVCEKVNIYNNKISAKSTGWTCGNRKWKL